MKVKLATIKDAAVSWLGRRDGGLSADDQMAFAAWLRADPRHAEEFARLEAASQALDALAAFRPKEDIQPDPNLPLPWARIKLVWLPLAAAAAVAMVVYVHWRSASPARASFSQTAITEVGGLQKMNLPDGSAIDLNTDSAVDVTFTAAERHVRLVRGEARFTVEKNPSRPFIVEASGVIVRAVGTAFDVRVDPDSIDVLVTEGRVRVNDARTGNPLIAPSQTQSGSAQEPPVVAAGQRAVISRKPFAPVLIPAAVAPAEISQLLAWEHRRLEFEPTPLGVLVAEFNRYNREKLVVGDPVAARLKVGGSFRVDDCDALVRLLESSFGIAAERSGNEIVLRARP